MTVEKCLECETIEKAKEQRYCDGHLGCGYYVSLKGEGEIEIITRIRKRHKCDSCGLPATHKLTFLLLNARSNPASAGFRGNDISWCSDRERFACDDCKDKTRRNPPRGHDWCGSYPLDKFPHMGLYWSKVEVKE